MKQFIQSHPDLVSLVGLGVVGLAFFYKTILFGLLPVPSDSLVGLYHPWRDLYSASNPRGVPFKNALITDPVRQQIPWRKQVVDQIKSGRLPLWNPTDFSGTPLSANVQAGAFYPLNVFFLFLDFPVAWTFLIILQLLLMGMFMYVYLRHLRISVYPSFTASLFWMFSGFAIAWVTWGTILQTALWLPLVLYSIDMIFRVESKMKLTIFLVFFWLVNCMHILGGHLQISFYILITAAGYTIWRCIDYEKKHLFRCVLIVAVTGLAGLGTLPQLKPFFILLSDSVRANETQWTNAGWFMPWQNLIQFIAPDYFGNPATLNYWGIWNYGEFVGYLSMAGCIFAIIGIMSRFRSRRFFLTVLAVSFVCILQNPVSIFLYVIRVPVWSFMQPTRLLFLITFSLTVCAAYGIETVFTKGYKHLKKILLVLGATLFLLSIASFVKSHWDTPEHMVQYAVSLRNLFVPSLLFVLVAGILIISNNLNRSPVNRKAVQVMLIVLILSDLFRFGWKFTPFTSREFFFPMTKSIEYLLSKPKPFRILSVDDRIFPPNTLGYFGLESVSGYDPLFKERYAEFVAAMERNESNIEGPFGFNRIITPKNIVSPLFTILNPKYVLSIDPIEQPNLKLVFQEGETKIYENIQVLPRLFFADRIILSANKKQTVHTFYDGVTDFHHVVVVEGTMKPDIYPSESDDMITLGSYMSDEIQATVRVNTDRFLVIGNIYDTGWKIFLDSKEIQTYRTNLIYMGIVVPAGTHRLDIRYNPNIL